MHASMGQETLLRTNYTTSCGLSGNLDPCDPASRGQNCY